MELTVWDKWREYVEENRLQVGLALAGLFLLGLGMFNVVRQGSDNSGIEIIPADSSEDSADNEKIVVDVAGAVENPGVYELEIGSRLNDALVAAGGLAENADRVWVRRFVNLAQVIGDGVKVYVPAEDEDLISVQKTPNGLVNINTASKSDLDGLWGIGVKRAEAIVNNRPYSNVNELVTKASIPQNVYDQIEGEIAVY